MTQPILTNRAIRSAKAKRIPAEDARAILIKSGRGVDLFTVSYSGADERSAVRRAQNMGHANVRSLTFKELFDEETREPESSA